MVIIAKMKFRFTRFFVKMRVYAKTGNSECAEITVSSFEQTLSVFIAIKHTKHAHVIHPLPRNPGCIKNNTRCTFCSLYHTQGVRGIIP